MVLRRRREGSTFARPLSVVGLLVLAEMDYRGMEFGPRWGRGFDTGTLGCPIGQCVSVTTPLRLPRKPTLIHLLRIVLVMLGGTPFVGSGSMPSPVVLPSDEGIVVSKARSAR